MARELRIRVDEMGSLELVDPDYGSLALTQSIDPSFSVRTAAIPGFVSPRFEHLRQTGVGLDKQALRAAPVAQLWRLHSTAMSSIRPVTTSGLAEQEASLLDLKAELAKRVLSYCTLCARRCGVDRTRGELGVCRLGTEALVTEHFVHIAEESPINPSLILTLAGCGLRCRFCQQYRVLDPKRVKAEQLSSELWTGLDRTGARSISFVGGNPDESLPSILRFLAAAPTWNLPIVWNNHGYSTAETLQLLDGVVDVYLPDFKYGSEACGVGLSGVRNYPDTAAAAIAQMLGQGVCVIVRILVLPGHNDCCHGPTLQRLKSLASGHLRISVRGQYCPDWKITAQDGELARRPKHEEVEELRETALALGLNLVD